MRDFAILLIHLIVTISRLMRPGGGRAVVAESLLLKHQLVVLNRGRDRAPNLRPMDRVVAGLCTLFIRPGRLLRIAVVLRPSTLLAFHAALVKRKYRRLFSPKRCGKPGPKGPPPELITAIVEIKARNPSWGCRRIVSCVRASNQQRRSTARITEALPSQAGCIRTFLAHAAGPFERQFVECRSVPL